MYLCPASSVGQSFDKAFRIGTHRTVNPEETVRRLNTLRIELGITRVADVTGMDRVGIPTAMAVRPSARSTAVTHGKGVTPIAAKAAALIAAVERHHAERVACPLRLSSAVELNAEQRILDPAQIPGAAPACSPKEPILWAEGRSLNGDVIWVPFGLVHLDLRRPATLGSDHFAAGAGGLGSGNTVEEAIVHGACEVVERDASERFRKAPDPERRRRRLDLESFDYALCRELLACYARASLAVAVWDLTSELRIPCFLCCVRDDHVPPGSPLAVVTGTGCHPSRAIALAHALCEAAQRRIARIGGLMDEADPIAPRRALDWDWLAFEMAAPAETRYLEVPTFDSASCLDDVAWLQKRFESSDITMAAVDLTQPKFPVCVVRAVATGLDARAESSRAVRESGMPLTAAARGAA
jgi:ribosomal protein S12 methylthiotransferase accessory factor